MPRVYYFVFLLVFVMVGCSSVKNAASTPAVTPPTPLEILLSDSALMHAHVGLMIKKAESDELIAAHNAEKYFVPASNTKLWTMYAALKHLGSRIVAARFSVSDDSIMIFNPSPDPSFLHPDFAYQPLDSFFRIHKRIKWESFHFKAEPYGAGWSWNDYDETYMLPRTPLPMYGGEVKFYLRDGELQNSINSKLLTTGRVTANGFNLSREFSANTYTILYGTDTTAHKPLPLINSLAGLLLRERYGLYWVPPAPVRPAYEKITLYSQPTDSLLRPLMHRSDNYFAEHVLLLASMEVLNVADDRAFTAHLLKTDLKEVPQQPRWADGSGLSRYNLFTPHDMVWLLQKMKNEFGMERIKGILPSGNQGTLRNYYTSLLGNMYAKTGTLSGVVALSGYVQAASGQQLLFSVLVNNHNGNAVAVRRAVERYLQNMVQIN